MKSKEKLNLKLKNITYKFDHHVFEDGCNQVSVVLAALTYGPKRDLDCLGWLRDPLGQWRYITLILWERKLARGQKVDMGYEADICLLRFFPFSTRFRSTDKSSNEWEINAKTFGYTLAINESRESAPSLIKVLEHFLLLLQSLEPSSFGISIMSKSFT